LETSNKIKEKKSPSSGGECCEIEWGVVQKILVFPILKKKISNTHHKDKHIVTSHTDTQNEMKVSNGWNGFLSFPSMHM